MSPRPSGSDSHAYIPQGAQQALARQMEHAVPAHLKQYVGNNAPSYIPPKVQKQLTSYMQKAAPSHLQQYAGAFVQQNVVDAGMRRNLATSSPGTPMQPVNPRNLSHSGFVPGEQADGMRILNHFEPTATPSAGSGQGSTQATQPESQYAETMQPAADNTGQPSNPNQSPYDFIMNPQKPTRKSAPLFGGNSMMQRVIVVVGILAIVIIAGAVLSSVLGAGGKGKTAGLLAVAQQQTELIHIATDGTTHTTTLPVQNLAQNILASVTSDNNALLSYMAKNKEKVTHKLLVAKQSSTIDASLKSAQENNTYDSTFKDIAQVQLKDYAIALQKAYKAGPGPKGKALLAKQYDAAKLLLAASQAN